MTKQEAIQKLKENYKDESSDWDKKWIVKDWIYFTNEYFDKWNYKVYWIECVDRGEREFIYEIKYDYHKTNNETKMVADILENMYRGLYIKFSKKEK